MIEKTKKLPVSVSFKLFKTNADEFLVPDPNNILDLIGIESGDYYKYGAISYLGVEITPLDIIKKMKRNKIKVQNETEYEKVLINYINQINNLKISNVIENATTEKGNFQIKKVANRRMRNHRNLP